MACRILMDKLAEAGTYGTYDDPMTEEALFVMGLTLRFVAVLDTRLSRCEEPDRIDSPSHDFMLEVSVLV